MIGRLWRRKAEEPADPKIICVLSEGRCGTHMLRSVLDQAPEIAGFGEIFGNAVTAPHSFFPFRTRFVCEDPDTRVAPTDEVIDVLVDSYLDWLRQEAGGRHVLIDVKYASTHHWNSVWQLPRARPRFFTYAARHGFKVIHLYRRNLLALHASYALAHKTGAWMKAARATDGEEPGNPDSVALEVSELVPALDRYAANRAMFDRWLEDLGGTVLAFAYEDLLAADGGIPADILDGLSRFLGLGAPPPAVPRTRKMARPLAEMVENFDDVTSALAGTDHADFAR